MSTEQITHFNEFLTSNLNASQHEAVTHKEGSLLIVAGAGSGKTRVITTRITHLILNQNVLPSTIIALTFTNKAAMEMKERIEKFLGNAIMNCHLWALFIHFVCDCSKQNSELLRKSIFFNS